MTSVIDPAGEKLIADAQDELTRELTEAIPDPVVAENIARKVKKLIFVIVTLMTSACVGPAPAPVSNACSNPVAAIIHPSRQDTTDTLRQIDVHNRAARDLCPDGR